MQIRVPSLHQIRQHAESVKVCRPACKRPVASPLLQIPPFHPFAFPLLPAQTPPAVESWLGQRKSLGFPPLPLRSAAQTCVAHQTTHRRHFQRTNCRRRARSSGLVSARLADIAARLPLVRMTTLPQHFTTAPIWKSRYPCRPIRCRTSCCPGRSIGS